MSIPAAAYARESERVRFAPYAECMDRDVVLVLRCPEESELSMLRPGSTFLSMLHFPTRVERAVRAISLDAIVDESGRRIVENLDMVAWNGTHEAFAQIRAHHPRFEPGPAAGARDVPWRRRRRRLGRPRLDAVRRPGAARTAGVGRRPRRRGDGRRRRPHTARGYMLTRLERTDLLIDATHRSDAATSVVPNPWLAALPEDAVVLELAADRTTSTLPRRSPRGSRASRMATSTGRPSRPTTPHGTSCRRRSRRSNVGVSSAATRGRACIRGRAWSCTGGNSSHCSARSSTAAG